MKLVPEESWYPHVKEILIVNGMGITVGICNVKTLIVKMELCKVSEMTLIR